MSMPSNKQWDSLRIALDSIYGLAYLRCDGYVLSLNWERAGKTTQRYELAVYVNGFIKGKWMVFRQKLDEDIPEIARRFYRPSLRQLHSNKHIKGMEKIFGKRYCRAGGYYDKRISCTPYWKTVESCIRHLKKHNQDIEILAYEDYRAATDQLNEAAQ